MGEKRTTSGWEVTVVDLDSKLRPVAEALLTQGEELRGICVATQVGVFKGRQVLLGVTDGRLFVQGMNRKFEPVGDTISYSTLDNRKSPTSGVSGSEKITGRPTNARFPRKPPCTKVPTAGPGIFISQATP